jgi:poly-beta-1,6-N-acetyl-D-glucosamine synthase
VLTYAVVTPARDEAENLARLGESLAEQAVAPLAWIIVDDGSTDGTGEVVRALAKAHPWIRLVTAPPSARIERGGKIVRAFQVGLEKLEATPDVVVKVDADVSFPADYFQRVLDAFELDPRLGMASGSACELRNGVWEERHMTAGSLWGAARAYRWECLQAVRPLEERMGWDGIDALKANLNEWETRIVPGLHFRHYRVEGERDGRRSLAWTAQGRASYYMGYRFSYLVVRSLHYTRRELAALAMITGYLGALVRREPRCDDELVRQALRERQRLRSLPTRAIEALGRSGQR